MNSQTISCKYCNKPHDDRVGCPEMKAAFPLFCVHCFPPKPVSEHKSLNGVFVHERTDCPEDTMYMMKEEDIKLDPKSFFDYPQEEKERLINKASEDSNKAQREVVEEAEKSEWEELTVKDIQLWLDKLERIQSIGAKVVHVRHLLESEKKKSALEALEKMRLQIGEMPESLKGATFTSEDISKAVNMFIDHLKEEYEKV